MIKSESVNLLGIDIAKMPMVDLIEYCDSHIVDRQPALLGVVNVAKLVNSRKDQKLRTSVQEADVVLADGLPVVWLSRLVGDPLPERVAGIDIMHRLLDLADRKHYSVYFLGAKPEVVEKVAEYTKTCHPGARIAGYRDGYFTAEQEEQVAVDIQRSRADILFVAMTSPKKENFLRCYGPMMQVPICHGVGGSFDVVAGVTKRAPMWMQGWGLEWLYRVIQEPGRMWKRYMVTNTKFIGLSLVEIVRHRLGWARLKAREGSQ